MLTAVLVVILFPLNYLHEKDKQLVKESVRQFNDIQLLLLQDQIAIGDFLSHETSNKLFFITGESEYLRKHYQLADSVQTILLNLNKKSSAYSEHLSLALDTIQSEYANYNKIVDSIVLNTYQRGYLNFGLIGELESYLYNFKHKYNIDKDVLNDLSISTNIYKLQGDLSSTNKINEILSKLEKTQDSELKSYVNGYKKSFSKLLKLDILLGLHSNVGLKNRYLKKAEYIRTHIANEGRNIEAYQKSQLRRLNYFYGAIAAVLILLSLIFSVHTSRYLVSHLEKLTAYISDFTHNKFKSNVKFNYRNSTTEIKNIYLEFRNMMAQLKVNEKIRDRALNEAEDNMHRYRELADLLPISIYETDELGNLSYVNRAWHNTFGYSAEDIQQGLNLIEIVNYNPSNQLFTNDHAQADYTAIRRDGHKFPATVFSDIIKLNGKKIGHRGIIVDNTHKHQYIESLKKETLKAVTSDKHKSHFLANMSHEIRTPMNSIIGFANLLSNDQISHNQKKEFAEHIQSSSDFLLKLIDDIIDVAKIEAGEIKIKKAACNPNNLVEELAASFEQSRSKQNPNVQLLTDIPEENLSFYTDDFRLRQILTNLLSNAYKFTEEGKIVLSLQKKNERMLEFSVSDTGIGMTREELNIIFQRFKRTKTTEDKKISGTGLGLAISKNLVELLGGQMWVSSEKGVGTRFYFEIPYVRVPKLIPRKEPAESKSIFSYDWENKKILLVEDDDDNRKFVKQLLLNTRVELIEAKNGREAIEAVNFHDDIDLILMDLQMPQLNGYDATKVIKNHFPHIHIIAQSALAMDSDREKAISYGCSDYVTKPIQIEPFLEKLDYFIRTEIPQSTSRNTKTNDTVQIKSSENN